MGLGRPPMPSPLGRQPVLQDDVVQLSAEVLRAARILAQRYLGRADDFNVSVTADGRVEIHGNFRGLDNHDSLVVDLRAERPNG